MAPFLVQGTVRDEAGRPMSDARVSFTQSPVPMPDLVALTGDDGSFTLAVPVPGSYTLGITVEGRPTVSKVVNVPGRNPEAFEVRVGGAG